MCRMESFVLPKYCDVLPGERALMVDSGAFSVQTGVKTKEEINIDSWIAFLKERPEVTRYVTMDVVGDPLTSWENTCKMWKAGLKPIPVFHYGTRHDRWEYLDRYLDCDEEQVPYIALGGVAGGSARQQRKVLQVFLDYAWRRIRERRWPAKIHAMGMTQQWLLERYPWRSADSVTWKVSQMYGNVMRMHKWGLQYGGNPRDDSWWRTQYNATPRRIKNWEGAYKTTAEVLLEYERTLTRLWAERGIVWPTDP